MKKMTLRELRAFCVAARISNKVKETRENMLVSFQARTNAIYTAVTIPVDPKTRENSALDMAKLVSIDPLEREYLEAVNSAPTATQAGAENKPGSYERLMGGAFGGG